MAYVNTGSFIQGSRPRSKKALREAVANDPQSVFFDGTSFLGPQFDGRPSDIPEGVTLTVTGPDPYTLRRWYASVTRDAATGKVTVK
jgi:hypothetical protein